MPELQRSDPLWQQIAKHYKGMILRGELRPGDRFPSIREVRDENGVSQSVAQRAFEHLHLAERLISPGPRGTVVAAPRAALSPQQRMRLAVPPASELVTVTAAGLVTAPAYVRPVFGLTDPAPAVIRREEIARQPDGKAGQLSVTWVHPRYRELVPELLMPEPLPDPRGAAHLIAARAAIPLDAVTGGVAFECREAKADGRELPALSLPVGAYVLAGVNGWRHGDDLLAYTEFVLPPNRVIEADIDPA